MTLFATITHSSRPPGTHTSAVSDLCLFEWFRWCVCVSVRAMVRTVRWSLTDEVNERTCIALCRMGSKCLHSGSNANAALNQNAVMCI